MADRKDSRVSAEVLRIINSLPAISFDSAERIPNTDPATEALIRVPEVTDAAGLNAAVHAAPDAGERGEHGGRGSENN